MGEWGEGGCRVDWEGSGGRERVVVEGENGGDGGEEGRIWGSG